MDKRFTTYPVFKPFHSLEAFTTTKLLTDNLHTRFTGDTTDIYLPHRKTLADQLGIEVEKLIFPRQTHSCNVVVINKGSDADLYNTDAITTKERGVCLCVQTADCVPVLLYDARQQAIAAIHSGWRGMVNQIISATISVMKYNFGSYPEDIRAAVGPAIGPKVYEVGIEVVELLNSKQLIDNNIIKINNQQKYLIDLWEIARKLLIREGIKDENIEINHECTFTNSAKYFSARRDGATTGRMASGIMLR